MQDDYDYYEDQDSFLFGDGIDTDPDPHDGETRRIDSTLEWALEELEEMVAAIRKFVPDRPDMTDDQVVRCVREWLREFGSTQMEADMDLILDAMPLVYALRSGTSVSKCFNYVGEHSFTIGPDIPNIPSLGIRGCQGDFDQDTDVVLEAAKDVNDLAQILWIRGRRVAERAPSSATADSEGNYIPMDPDYDKQPEHEEPDGEVPASNSDYDEMVKMLAEEDIDKFFDYIFGTSKAPDEEHSSDAEGEPHGG